MRSWQKLLLAAAAAGGLFYYVQDHRGCLRSPHAFDLMVGQTRTVACGRAKVTYDTNSPTPALAVECGGPTQSASVSTGVWAEACHLQFELVEADGQWADFNAHY